MLFPAVTQIKQQAVMEASLAGIIQRVLASERRAREAEDRAVAAEARASALEARLQEKEELLQEIEDHASTVYYLGHEIDRNGNLKDDGQDVSGRPIRTSIGKVIANTMVDILQSISGLSAT